MIRESSITANRRGVEAATGERLSKQKVRQRGSCRRTRLNWAEDHASFRLSFMQMFSSPTECEYG